ncbi:hypothetical protein NEFER01_1063 [Nematocida sp. LUAm1]|nr:hypothetical protein NEFER02_0838 [Nematocida sp. LUAm2]KAI5177861.1 hypothetical protein NEFER01_1063 [Nematocida sp. LUAm1]
MIKLQSLFIIFSFICFVFGGCSERELRERESIFDYLEEQSLPLIEKYSLYVKNEFLKINQEFIIKIRENILEERQNLTPSNNTAKKTGDVVEDDWLCKFMSDNGILRIFPNLQGETEDKRVYNEIASFFRGKIQSSAEPKSFALTEDHEDEFKCRFFFEMSLHILYKKGWSDFYSKIKKLRNFSDSIAKNNPNGYVSYINRQMAAVNPTEYFEMVYIWVVLMDNAKDMFTLPFSDTFIKWNRAGPHLSGTSNDPDFYLRAVQRNYKYFYLAFTEAFSARTSDTDYTGFFKRLDDILKRVPFNNELKGLAPVITNICKRSTLQKDGTYSIEEGAHMIYSVILILHPLGCILERPLGKTQPIPNVSIQACEYIVPTSFHPNGDESFNNQKQKWFKFDIRGNLFSTDLNVLREPTRTLNDRCGYYFGANYIRIHMNSKTLNDNYRLTLLIELYSNLVHSKNTHVELYDLENFKEDENSIMPNDHIEIFVPFMPNTHATLEDSPRAVNWDYSHEHDTPILEHYNRQSKPSLFSGLKKFFIAVFSFSQLSIIGFCMVVLFLMKYAFPLILPIALLAMSFILLPFEGTVNLLKAYGVSLLLLLITVSIYGVVVLTNTNPIVASSTVATYFFIGTLVVEWIFIAFSAFLCLYALPKETLIRKRSLTALSLIFYGLAVMGTVLLIGASIFSIFFGTPLFLYYLLQSHVLLFVAIMFFCGSIFDHLVNHLRREDDSNDPKIKTSKIIRFSVLLVILAGVGWIMYSLYSKGMLHALFEETPETLKKLISPESIPKISIIPPSGSQSGVLSMIDIIRTMLNV